MIERRNLILIFSWFSWIGATGTKVSKSEFGEEIKPKDQSESTKFENISAAQKHFQSTEFVEAVCTKYKQDKNTLEDLCEKDKELPELITTVADKLKEISCIADECRNCFITGDGEKKRKLITQLSVELKSLRDALGEETILASTRCALEDIDKSIPQDTDEQINNLLTTHSAVLELMPLLEPGFPKMRGGSISEQPIKGFCGNFDVDLDSVINKICSTINQLRKYSHKIFENKGLESERISELMCALGPDIAQHLFQTFKAEDVPLILEELGIRDGLPGEVNKAVLESEMGGIRLSMLYAPKTQSILELIIDSTKKEQANALQKHCEELQKYQDEVDPEKRDKSYAIYSAEIDRLNTRLEQAKKEVENETSINLILLLIHSWKPADSTNKLSFKNLLKVFENMFGLVYFEAFGKLWPDMDVNDFSKDSDDFAKSYKLKHKELKSQMHKNLQQFSEAETSDPVRITATKNCLLMFKLQLQRLGDLIETAKKIEITNYGWCLIALSNFRKLFQDNLPIVVKEIIDGKIDLSDPFRDNKSDGLKLSNLKKIVDDFIKLLDEVDQTIEKSELTLGNLEKNATYLGEKVQEKGVTEKAPETVSESNA